jgi:hypothetical protein
MPRRKKKRGRPATGRDPLICVRIPEWLLQKIDQWDNRGPTRAPRSIVIRRLIAAGLKELPSWVDEDPKGLKKKRTKRSTRLTSGQPSPPPPPAAITFKRPPRKIRIGS